MRVAAASDNLADAWRSVVPPLAQRPAGSVLILGGGAKSIGLYAAGLAVAHGASVVTYVDPNPGRRAIAEEFGAGARPPKTTLSGRYDVVVEATSTASGLREVVRALAPGGVCTAVGYYLSSGTRVPLMHMYDRRHPATWRLARPSDPARPAELHRAQRVPRRARHDDNRRLAGRPSRLRRPDDQAHVATRSTHGRSLTACYRYPCHAAALTALLLIVRSGRDRGRYSDARTSAEASAGTHRERSRTGAEHQDRDAGGPFDIMLSI
jgi:zinc-binding dehydrogenase